MIQTWLPLPNFKDSIRSLSDAHLGLQRLHVLHVIEVIHDVEVSDLPISYVPEDPRPVIEMWENYEMQLLEYGLEACDEWSVRRGKKDKYYDSIMKHLDWATSEESNMGKPPWFGDVDFHMSHQSALLRADKSHYSAYFVANIEKPLIWPKVTDG